MVIICTEVETLLISAGRMIQTIFRSQHMFKRLSGAPIDQSKLPRRSTRIGKV